jgi:ribosome biogenesis GTPase
MNNTNEELFKGRISAIHKNNYTIRFEGKDIPARLKGSFYDLMTDRFPVVGDYVSFEYNPIGDSLIVSVLERSGLLQRPDQAKTGVMQYMVANVDYTFIVTSLNEDYSYNRIARYVSVVLQGHSIPVVVLTKADLCSNYGRYIREVESISDKVRAHAISALYGIGVDELQEYMRPDITICLMGSSGAGKSTLLNAFAGGEIMRTSSVRESDSTGRHTTTYRQLIELNNGVSIIDTPGMREIGMANTELGIDNTFSDIAKLEKQCKFSDCQHDTEPGCAVKAAIERGDLSVDRYILYKSLSSENTKNYAKKKEISKWAKAAKKIKRDSF